MGIISDPDELKYEFHVILSDYEELILTCENNIEKLQEYDKNLLNMGNSLINTIYSNSIRSFVSSVEESYQTKMLTEAGYDKFTPLLNKWRTKSQNNEVDEWGFNDFKNDLSLLQFTLGGQSPIYLFEENIWKPHFEEPYKRAKEAVKRLQKILESKSNKLLLNRWYLYVLANSAMPDLVKVGKTNRQASVRAQELSNATGLPTPFIVVYEQLFEDCDAAEEFVHTMLTHKGYRVSDNREFFRVPVSEVVRLILQAPGAINRENLNK